MPVCLERRRVLLAAQAPECARLRGLFDEERVPGWEAGEANRFEQARFLLQMSPWDVVLLDGSLVGCGDTPGLAWLARQDAAPVLFLADTTPDMVREALSHGAHTWMPRYLAFDHPPLLAAVLDRVALLGDLRRRTEVAQAALHDSRQQVNRLVNMLWEAAPGEGPGPWFSQRHVMERLQEELARARRHGGPLTVVLGEVHPAEPERLPPADARQLAALTAQRLGQGKRHCDVAGQYGRNGFLLVLPRATSQEAAGCCRRLRPLLEHPPAASLPPLHACFGIASYSPAVSSLTGLLSRAEQSLDQARVEREQQVEPRPGA